MVVTLECSLLNISFHLFERQRQANMFHPLVPIPNANNNCGWPCQSQEPSTPSRSPVWVAGTRVREPSPAGSRSQAWTLSPAVSQQLWPFGCKPTDGRNWSLPISNSAFQVNKWGSCLFCFFLFLFVYFGRRLHILHVKCTLWKPAWLSKFLLLKATLIFFLFFFF